MGLGARFICSAHRENKHVNIFLRVGGGVGGIRHDWAKKLKAPGKHQKSLEYMGNHRKQVKIPENSGTFF